LYYTAVNIILPIFRLLWY